MKTPSPYVRNLFRKTDFALCFFDVSFATITTPMQRMQMIYVCS